MDDTRSDRPPERGVSSGAPAWRTSGPARYSTDPRDFGWVRENIPCQTACPAETNIPAYIRMIVEGRYDKAYEINALAYVLPGVLARICSRPCEDACRHAWPGNGEPVDICHLKRAAADMRSPGKGPAGPFRSPSPASGKRVAVVGAGPAGIAVAHDLAIFGHTVTLFEREEIPGGMLYYGIPDFRLPRDILADEITMALQFGVEIRCGVGVGNGAGEIPVSRLLAEYDAVVLCTGTMKGNPLPLKQRESKDDPAGTVPGVEYGLDFLMELHRGVDKTVGRRVAVIGGGFTAMDCTRVARRLGAVEVANHIRTTEEFIPVWPEEVAEAKREGVRIRGLRSPVDLDVGEEGIAGVKFVRNRLGDWRDATRRQAIAIPGTEFVEPCDTLLICIGQQTVHDFLDVEAKLDRWGNMAIDESGMTSVDGLFAAGDYVGGASTVIEAIGHGREIATRVDAWLIGRRRRERAVKITPMETMYRTRSDDFIPRQHMTMEPMETRFRDLVTEAEKGFETDAACTEGKRCYLCSLNFEIDVDNCIYCRACIDIAPKNCIKLVEGVEVNEDGSYGALREADAWQDARAIWIDNNECIRCGACYEVCPTRCISISRKELVMREFA